MRPEDPLPPDETTSFLHTSDRGELRLWLAAPTVLVFKYRGYSDAGYLPFIERVYQRTLANVEGPIAVFADCELQTGYDTEFRRGIAAWSKAIVPFPTPYCLYVKSRLVAMGIAVARLAVGRDAQHAEVVSNREAYRSKLEAAVRASEIRAAVSATSAGSSDRSSSSSEGGYGAR
jgi:hypothetical protein